MKTCNRDHLPENEFMQMIGLCDELKEQKQVRKYYPCTVCGYITKKGEFQYGHDSSLHYYCERKCSGTSMIKLVPMQ